MNNKPREKISISTLKNYTLHELKNIGKELGLKPRREKLSMIEDIMKCMKTYEKYKKKKIDKYTRIKQIGNKGKEGITYLVKTREGEEFAMKTFRKTKSSVKLENEYNLQKIAASVGVSPKVYDFDTVSKYIIMDRMDTHLIDIMKKQKGNLTKSQQLRVIEIFRKLDDVGVFHGDANPLNYMLKNKIIYIIDYGYSKKCNDKLYKKLGTSTPNMTLMLLGFILKLKDMNCPSTSYKYLIHHIPKITRERFQLVG